MYGGTKRYVIHRVCHSKIHSVLSEKELAAHFNLDFHFAHVDTIFRRVFGRA